MIIEPKLMYAFPLEINKDVINKTIISIKDKDKFYYFFSA